MKITNLKTAIAKVFTVGLLAGAVVMAAPQKAEAQVSFGVRVGGGYGRPVYLPPPVYGYNAYYGRPYDRYAFERRQEFLRHEERERFERFHHDGWR